MFEHSEETVSEVKWDGEGDVEFTFSKCTSWCGAKRKDFWDPDKEWEKIIKPGSKIRLWTVQCSMVMGFEVWHKDQWRSQ